MIKGLDPVATPRTASGRRLRSSEMVSAANLPTSSGFVLMTPSIGLVFPLPQRVPIDPHAANLPVLIEKHSVGYVSRLQTTEPVCHSEDLSRDSRSGLGCCKGTPAYVFYGSGGRQRHAGVWG